MAPPPGDCKLMDTRHIKGTSSANGVEWVAAQHKRPFMGDQPVKFLLVLRKLFPLSLRWPSFVTIDSDSGVACRQSLRELCSQRADEPLYTEGIVFEVPLRIRNNLYIAGRSEERRVGKECRSRWS